MEVVMVRCPFCGFTDPTEARFSRLEISKDGGPPRETPVCDRCAARLVNELVRKGATVHPGASVN